MPKLSYWLPQGGEALSTPGQLVLQPRSQAQPPWLRTPPLKSLTVFSASSQLTFQGEGC